MRRRHLFLMVLSSLGVFAAALPALAGSHQIEDPEGDHPVPFVDLVGVGLGVVSDRGGQSLQVTFQLAGPVTPESRNLMTGYTFRAKAGSCALRVAWFAYPQVTEPAGLPIGSPGAACGDREVGGSFKLQDNKVIVQVPLRDLKGVSVGTVMTGLTAHTAPGQGLADDDTGALTMAGDAASSDKPWTVAAG